MPLKIKVMDTEDVKVPFYLKKSEANEHGECLDEKEQPLPGRKHIQGKTVPEPIYWSEYMQNKNEGAF